MTITNTRPTAPARSRSAVRCLEQAPNEVLVETSPIDRATKLTIGLRLTAVANVPSEWTHRAVRRWRGARSSLALFALPMALGGCVGEVGVGRPDSGTITDAGATSEAGCAMECRGPTPVCLAGRCVACEPGSGQCIGATPQICSPVGQWSTGAECGGATPYCAAGRCIDTHVMGSFGTLGPRPASGSLRVRDDGLELGASVCKGSVCLTGGVAR